MNTIKIFWKDLTTEKQQEILAIAGDNQNFDIFPITEIYISQEE